MSQNNVIIVAGGKGLRMGGELPKQFIAIGGKPILMHTIEAFYNFDNDIKIVLILPVSHQEYWAELCAEYKFDLPHIIATGGETRFHSVKNGLALIESGMVGVQDGVRPFPSKKLIARCFKEAEQHQAVIPVIHSVDSLREISDDGDSKIVDRAKIRLIQTPQVFTVDLLKKAYQTEYKDTITDDASVVEALGIHIYLAKGETTNIKITTPIDLKIGELILNNKIKE